MSRGRPRRGESHPKQAYDLFPDMASADPLVFERSARAAGYTCIAGLDEAGRGPLAGPVVAAAVVLPEGLMMQGLTDSKQVSERERTRLFDEIKERSVCHGIGVVDAGTIDDVNILQATIIAMEQALQSLYPQPDYLLLDALTLPRVPLPQKALVKGDCRSHSIAAASILAKVTRDRIMQQLHDEFPRYNFQKHKGYGTKEHLALLREHGPCAVHRKTFQPVAVMLEGDGR